MKTKKSLILQDIVGLFVSIFIFVLPFVFMIFNSLKERKEANFLHFAFPKKVLWANYKEVIQTSNYAIMRAFKNSLLITLFSLILLIVMCSMAAYSIQRRNDKQTNILTSLFMAGLMLPPAILPTIWVMQYLHIYKTMFSMVMIETALQMPFTILLYRGFMSTVPKEMEEASYMDGCSKLRVYAQIIFPLLKPITATVIILDAVTIFNDFMNPLYFFPGKDNITVQLTLYNFMGKFTSSYNLLFADTILITLPMFLLFIIFNKKIIAGMSQGSVKG